MRPSRELFILTMALGEGVGRSGDFEITFPIADEELMTSAKTKWKDSHSIQLESRGC